MVEAKVGWWRVEGWADGVGGRVGWKLEEMGGFGREDG